VGKPWGKVTRHGRAAGSGMNTNETCEVQGSESVRGLATTVSGLGAPLAWEEGGKSHRRLGKTNEAQVKPIQTDDEAATTTVRTKELARRILREQQLTSSQKSRHMVPRGNG
jgi:hypothetical protein